MAAIHFCSSVLQEEEKISNWKRKMRSRRAKLREKTGAETCVMVAATARTINKNDMPPCCTT